MRVWKPSGPPSRPAAAPDLPLDHELAAESDTRKEAYIAAMDSMIKACPACGIVRKCTLESSMPAVQREHAAVQRAVADHMNTTVFTRLLLTGCGALEQATQLPPVNGGGCQRRKFSSPTPTEFGGPFRRNDSGAACSLGWETPRP